ncbi:MAG TPA: ABC transporter permease [Nitrolancea sp.]|nr:ABC transporter permease [Nitrolancea sp.]
MRFLSIRLGFYAVTAWAAITLNFVIPRLIPGNPLAALIAREHVQANASTMKAMSVQFGLDQHSSIFSQYFTYLGNLLHGQLGISFTYYPSTVVSVIGSALPWTLALVGTATIVSFVLGTLLGVWSAWKRGTWADHLLPFTAFFAALPYFWLASVLVLIFSVELGWLPISGAYSPELTIRPDLTFVLSALRYGFLPAATIVISSLAGWLLGMRNVMVPTIAEDYVLLAEAKGLRTRRVVFSYAARNALLPTVANFALSLGFVVAGALLTEIVFSYPGVGYQLYQAVTNQDYPLMQGLFLIITLLVLAANLCADLVYAVLDPRTSGAHG